MPYHRTDAKKKQTPADLFRGQESLQATHGCEVIVAELMLMTPRGGTQTSPPAITPPVLAAAEHPA
jgi:hypothetical protein